MSLYRLHTVAILEKIMGRLLQSRGVWGHAPPGKFLNYRPAQINFEGVLNNEIFV